MVGSSYRQQMPGQARSDASAQYTVGTINIWQTHWTIIIGIVYYV